VSHHFYVIILRILRFILSGFADLQAVLPFVAYYFTDGPWQRTWVRYGYDPRTDKESRMYAVSTESLLFLLTG
jgi:hypothetical protein